MCLDLYCTGGNQREIDRQRAAKRAEKGGKGKKKDADGNSAKQMLTNKKEKCVALDPSRLFWCSLFYRSRLLSREVALMAPVLFSDSVLQPVAPCVVSSSFVLHPRCCCLPPTLFFRLWMTQGC